MKEIISLRKPREKHFLNEDGTFTAYVYDEDIHYLKNGKYINIDNCVIEKDDFYTVKDNLLNLFFAKKNSTNFLVKIQNKNYELKLDLLEKKINANIEKNKIIYHNILENIDIQYDILANKIKDTIILKNKNNQYAVLKYKIETNLHLSLDNEGKIIVSDKKEHLFNIEKPTLTDVNEISYPIHYTLEKIDNYYLLGFHINEEILNTEDIYPLLIDPTINVKNDESIFDTYIYPGDTEINRNNTDILKVGVDTDNTIYRTLIKFTLPIIGTACEVIDAKVYLTSHQKSFIFNEIESNQRITNVHAINTNWEENSASWDEMHNKYDDRVEDYFYPEVTKLKLDINDENKSNFVYELQYSSFNITNLVKKWYAGLDNNGILLKYANEIPLNENKKNECWFYSKNNTITVENLENPKPFLSITYRNQNGLEDYMSYQTINLQQGISYVNNLNGNVTNIFDIAKTLDNKFPLQLNLIYNTNDVLTNSNLGCGLGFKWNYFQTIHEVNFDNISLEYLDSDGTLHYFRNIDNKLIDEDGLGLTATKENDTYALIDKSDNKLEFTKINSSNTIYYLTKITNSNQYTITLKYNNEGKIINLYDGANEETIIHYNSDKIEISNKYTTTIIMHENNQITSIKTKYGTTLLYYNNQNLISKITDNNGLSKEYTYFDCIPYRIKKLTELGLNNKAGNSLEFQYEYNVTRIKDNKGRVTAYTFNNLGNTIGITSLKNKDDFLDGYGIKQEYYEKYNENLKNKNKISLETDSTKYTNNLLIDSSFEKNMYDNRTTDFARTGTKSLKIINTFSYSLPNRTKTAVYTFSGYFKTKNTFTLSLLEDDQKVKETNILQSDDFVRTSISCNLDSSKTYKIQITPLNENSVVYMDDVQLEIGESPNYYNLIENSNFENGMNSWTYSGSDQFGNELQNGEIITLENGAKAYTFHSKLLTSASLEQVLPISGKKNDSFRLSFWYKNEGVKDSLENEFANMVLLGFGYIEEEDNGRGLIPITLNLHNEEWQFFESVFTAEDDYNNIWLTFFSQNEVNTFSFTHITLTKDLENNSYGYDSEGNLTVAVGKNKEVTKFQYDKKNQLTSIFEPKGNHFSFEYDNTNTNQVLRGISKCGIANKINYDENNNPIETIIKNENSTMENTKSFYVRLKSSNQYMLPNYHALMPVLQRPTCSNESWDFEKLENTDCYSIKSSVIPLSLCVGTETTAYSLSKGKGDSYELIKNDNGSISIKYTEADVCLTAEGNYFVGKKYDKNDPNQQFYLEPFESTKYIKTSAEYTSDGKFIKSMTGHLDRTTKYDINSTTGLLKSVTDPLGQITNYTYNHKDQISKVEKNNHSTDYTYNEQDLLSKITCENKEYNFTYDDFLNTKEVKINNQTLVTNEYEENNGNLLSANYGNHTSVNYTYDEFDRIKTLTKGNKTYNYHYNNLNDLTKITSNNETYLYYYDLAERLSRYEFNNNSIDYDYDLNNNITQKIYSHDNENKIVNYTYNEDDSIIKVTLDNNEVNFTYDNLGRLIKKDINKNLPIEYEYHSNGNKTSFVLKSMKIDNELYEYLYDEVYNITDIYRNKELLNHYEYDNENELIEDNNYSLNTTTKYIYDTSGNILKKEDYELNTSTLLQVNIYEYNNTNWKDQLTKFNTTTITYDEIGNPITIGNTYLSWYGRELQSLENNLSNIEYFYNKDGIRTKKIVNGIETNYFVENSNIIFEETNGNMLFFMRTDENDLIGFIYNDETYYYKKNYQGDIIGIYDNNYNLLCTYEYDSYGALVSQKDVLGNPIEDENHIANINPYRYRSYYYDKESNLYYLNSRYYNPLWGRFLNADGIIGTSESYLGYNLYAYCNNNPVINVDSEGNFSLKNLWNKVTNGAKKIIKGVAAISSKALGYIIKRPLAGNMLAKSFNSEKELSSKTKNKLSETLRNSSQVKQKVNECIEDFKINKNTYCETSIAFTGLSDLHLAVGRAKISVSIVPIDKNYWANVIISDTYNFDPNTNKLSVANALNSLGLFFQDNNLISPYEWDVNYAILVE